MCEQCEQIDEKIRRYRRFLTLGLDALTVDRIDGLIQELQKRKLALPCSTSSKTTH
jgi:hypothetical protein